MNDRELKNEKKALALVEAAVVLADEANTLHGQSLFFDKDWNFVDVVAVLRETAEGLRNLIEEESV